MESKKTELIDFVNELKRTRELYEPDWYRCFFAYENNCFIGYNRATGQLVRTPYRKKFFNNFPEVKKQCDAFENLLLLFMPLFVFYPNDIADKQSKEQAKYLSRAMKQKYIDWDSQNLVHQYIHNALKYPMSFWEFNIENRPVDGQLKRVINCSIGDPFDWYFDPRIPFEDNMRVVKVLRKSLKEIEEYKLFGGKKPKGSGVTVGEDMKEMIMSDKYSHRPYEGGSESYICYQIFEKTSKGINSTIIDQSGNVLLEDKYENAIFYPVVPLKLSSGDYYQPSFVSNLIPIARSISITANRLEDFYLRFVKGQYLAREGNDITFSDENNIVVNYTTEEPTIVPTPVLPQGAIEWYKDLFHITERYGVNLVALGGAPKTSNLRSGRQMDQHVKNQQMQQKTALDNMMQSFRRIAEIYMYYWSNNTDITEEMVFKQNESGQQNEEFQKQGFIGEKYKGKDPKAIPIPRTIKNLEVQIEDVSTASSQAKFEKVLEVAKELGGIDPAFHDIIIDMLDLGSTSDIIDKMQMNKSLLDNPEFKALIEQARAGQVPPEEAKALITLIKFLSQSSPVMGPDKSGVQSKGGPSLPQGGLSPEDLANIEKSGGSEKNVPAQK